MASLITRRSQLQWVALLAVAVVLPTVSLLWFMSRVVANERLVIRQKLAALYQDKLTEAAAKTETLFTNRLAALDDIKESDNPYPAFRRLVLENGVQGVVIWNSNGTRFYPRPADAIADQFATESPLAAAWQLEFAQQHYDAAAQLYDGLSSDHDPHVALAAILGRSRCLSRLGRLDEAVQTCQKAALAAAGSTNDPALRLTIENARLLLLSLLSRSDQSSANTEMFHRTAAALEKDLYNSGQDRAFFSASENLFFARKLLDSLRAVSGAGNSGSADQLARLASAEELSIAASGSVQAFNGQFDTFFPIEVGQQSFYAIRHRTPTAVMLLLVSANGMEASLQPYVKTFPGRDVSVQITDASGRIVLGASHSGARPVATAALPVGFSGWKAELHLAAGDVFERVASRQIAVYIWTGVLVILLILVAAGVATQAVGRQIRLNRMKNDFIATVSHELKTPLASMRVLVDTLLEGRVRDEAQARQYLELTAKENERLSRMIDNFLTFSRMERNKNAFTLAEAKPAAIAADAAESVQTKFAARDCRLSLDVAGNLPDVDADHDAMVTVLVNLLDNACKYSAEDKRVQLAVSEEAGFVRFTVSDNGIGIGRRHLRKIFDSFYQVDNSLARKAEGCGLGLSIVKFIVHAHKGKIDVDSKPGKGSTFTVRLPVRRRNGD